ncbi:ABC-2 type transport system permease protein [Virgibacillus natechei]|uniref:ABC-2 type transport system permease protein n=1 Tax=Virgibacillus natechei TaxID=1216297 RepID=A0ABS4II75_9BACI|nr:hypothetical protein [Virgibacillus natechei]MBP1970654.1 ABC-2 type transport system permease protein [Virgibacillus natechei]UZD13960.1 hypothetical protein OLD84_05335 [Virgibacillus natechei]
MLAKILKSYEFFLVFNKEVFYNKFSYLWTLVIPGFFLVINTWGIGSSFTYSEFRDVMFFYWSFIILMTAANGIGVGILDMRDNNYLKTYKYISGSKTPILLGRIESQCFFLLVNIIFFTLVSGFVFNQPTGSLLLTGAFVSVLVAIPVFLLLLIVTTLPFESNSVAQVLILFIIMLANLTSFNSDFQLMTDYIQVFNPAVVIGNSATVLHDFFLGNSNSMFIISVVPLILYSLIGMLAYYRLDIISKKGR